MQLFDSYTKSLNNLIDLYKQLNTDDEVIHDKGDGKNTNNKTSSPVQVTNHPYQLKKNIQTRP